MSAGAAVLAAVLQAATPTPSATTQAPLDVDLVTPGLGGFLTLFGLAVALYFLGRSMARRVQRTNQRARLAQQEADEAAAARRAAAPAEGVDTDGVDAGGVDTAGVDTDGTGPVGEPQDPSRP